MNDSVKIVAEFHVQKSSADKRFKALFPKLKNLKGKKLDAQAEELNEEAFQQIDCLDCGNCCKSIPARLNETDVNRISKDLGMKNAAFKDEYVRVDDDGDMVMKSSPCPFLLEDNACMIYNIRPKGCRQYPHTYPGDFSKHINLHKVNATYCPAVFHILEAFEKIV